MAGERQPAGPTVVVASKAEAGVEVGEVVDHFVEGIRFLLEAGGDGQAVALGEEADDPSATGGDATGVDQAQPPPEHRGARAGGQCAAGLHQFAAGAIGGEHLALARTPEGLAQGIHGHAHREFGEADLGGDLLRRLDDADDGGVPSGEALFDERADALAPELERGVATVPVDQAANPLDQEDTVAGDAVGHGEGAAVNGEALAFLEHAELAEPDLVEGGGFAEGGAQPVTAGGVGQPDLTQGPALRGGGSVPIRRGCWPFRGGADGRGGRVRRRS
ncbi:MAG: hypothetical protein M5U12_02630 [Verrucomicrobia bacterium]|nr:hypothetical protein [Verrucomicrobiota bacterium]